MKKFKAIISDFDGTLIADKLSLNKEVKNAIKLYVSSGGIFSIATGRDYYGILKNICQDLGLETLQIVRGGAEIVSAKTHEVVWGRYIDSSLLKELLAFLQAKEEIYFVAERGKKICTKNGRPLPMFGPMAEFDDIQNLPMDGVAKVFLPAAENKPEKVLTLHDEIKKAFPRLHTIKTSYKKFIGLDITDGGVSKHTAVLEYSKLTGLDPKEIVGVGDSYNDYPLLSACGYKAVIKNAPKELLDIADKVIPPQEENGIIDVLKMCVDNS